MPQNTIVIKIIGRVKIKNIYSKRALHINRLNSAFYGYQSKLKMDNLICSLTEEQLNIINNLTKWDRDEVLEKLMDGTSKFKVLPDDIKDPEVIVFITNKLPLLDRHNEILFTSGNPFTSNKSKREASGFLYLNSAYKGITSVHRVEQVTYQQLIDRHLKTLEKIRKNENRLPEDLQQEWLKIQRNIINLKGNQKFDYTSNILIMLKISREIDAHLYKTLSTTLYYNLFYSSVQTLLEFGSFLKDCCYWKAKVLENFPRIIV